MAGQTQTTTKGKVNGVDCDQLFETMDAIQDTPTIAKFKFRAHNQWINGGHNRTTIGDFYGAGQTHTRSKPFVLDADEPPILLGEDQGANPVKSAHRFGGLHDHRHYVPRGRAGNQAGGSGVHTGGGSRPPWFPGIVGERQAGL